MNENQPNPTASLSPRFRITARDILTFAIGILTALILAVGIKTAVNPKFLTGTAADFDSIVRYQLFPSGATMSTIDTDYKYLSEIVFLYQPSGNALALKNTVPCDGRPMDMRTNTALFAALGAAAADAGSTSFNLPNLTNSVPGTNISCCIQTNGQYPLPGGSVVTSSNHISYVIGKTPDVLTDPENSYLYYDDTYLGEIDLFKTNDQALLSGKYLPCEGQLLKASDYQVLGDLIAPNQAAFALPDLSDSSPIEGAEFYICINGTYPYH